MRTKQLFFQCKIFLGKEERVPQLSCVMTRWLVDYIYASVQTTVWQLSVANYRVAIFSVPDFAFSKAARQVRRVTLGFEAKNIALTCRLI